MSSTLLRKKYGTGKTLSVKAQSAKCLPRKANAQRRGEIFSQTFHYYFLFHKIFSGSFQTMPPQHIQIEHSESSKSLSSKHDGESTSDPSQSNTNNRSDGSTSNESFGKEETKIVNRTKLIVYITLLLTSVAISVVAFFFVKNSEESVFEAEVRRFFRSTNCIEEASFS